MTLMIQIEKTRFHFQSLLVFLLQFHLRQEGLLPFAKGLLGPQENGKTAKSWWNVLRLKRNDEFDPVTEKLRKINEKVCAILSVKK